MNAKILLSITKKTLSGWSEDNVSRLAAALAYYAAFTIAPFLVICIGIIGLFFGTEAAQNQVLEQASSLLGANTTTQLSSMIESTQTQSTNIWLTILGLIILLIGASGFFAQLNDGLNTIWGVKLKAKSSWIYVIRDRFVSLTMVLGVAFLFLISLIFNAIVTVIANYFSEKIPGLEMIWLILNFVISFGLTTVLFALIFKILPDVLIEWRNVWVGAIVTALLFTIGKFLLELYLTYGNVGSAYGAAGSLILILVWVYYSSQILFLGAEFTKAYTLHYDSQIKPSAHFELEEN